MKQSKQREIEEINAHLEQRSLQLKQSQQRATANDERVAEQQKLIDDLHAAHEALAERCRAAEQRAAGLSLILTVLLALMFRL